MLADRVNRQFRVERPNQLWVSDFTCVSPWQGWVCVAFVVDVFGRLAGLLRGSAGAALRRRLGATPAGPQRELADEQLHVAGFSTDSPDERTDHLGIGAGVRTLPPATLCHWIARVGRFSFDLGDVNGPDAGAATARSNVSRVRAASAKCAAACTPA